METKRALRWGRVFFVHGHAEIEKAGENIAGQGKDVR